MTTLHSFTFNVDGAFPNAALTLGSDGNFYGTTESGGSQLSGTVFMITPAGAFTSLHALVGADGTDPQSSLVQGSDGNFYGTTTGVGTGGNGTIFKITPAGVFSILHTFTGGADGAFPFAGLAQGSDGNFYGMTTSSGTQRGDGAVFKITPAGVLTILYEFTDGGPGRGSNGALTLGSGGNFYGTTSSGGRDGNGTMFQITPAGVLTTLYAFSGGADGSPSYSSVIQGNDGNLYGTSSQGGVVGLGNVYRLDFPLPAVSSKAVSAQIGLSFSFQIIATNSPTRFGASNLPPGLNVDSNTGMISGTPTQTGTFTIDLSAMNSFGTRSGTLTLMVAPAPVVTLTPNAPQVAAGSGKSGQFTLSLSAPPVADLVIKYTIQGSAINGVDYDLIKAHKKIKAGSTSKIINIVPEGDLGGASKKAVALVLKPGAGYVLGTTGKVKVTILSGP